MPPPIRRSPGSFSQPFDPYARPGPSTAGASSPAEPPDAHGLSSRSSSASAAPRQSLGPASPAAPADTHRSPAWNPDAPEDWPIDLADAYDSAIQLLQAASDMQGVETIDPRLLMQAPVPELDLGQPLLPVEAEASPEQPAAPSPASPQPGPSQPQAVSQTPAMRAHLAALPEGEPSTKRDRFKALLHRSMALERMGSRAWDERDMALVAGGLGPRAVREIKARMEFHTDSPATLHAVDVLAELGGGRSKTARFRALLRYSRAHVEDGQLHDESMARAAGDLDSKGVRQVKAEAEFASGTGDRPGVQTAQLALDDAAPEHVASDDAKYRTLLRLAKQDDEVAALPGTVLRRLADDISEFRARQIRREAEFQAPPAD